jgi:hypothetical protein
MLERWSPKEQRKNGQKNKNMFSKMLLHRTFEQLVLPTKRRTPSGGYKKAIVQSSLRCTTFVWHIALL